MKNLRARLCGLGPRDLLHLEAGLCLYSARLGTCRVQVGFPSRSRQHQVTGGRRGAIKLAEAWGVRREWLSRRQLGPRGVPAARRVIAVSSQVDKRALLCAASCRDAHTLCAWVRCFKFEPVVQATT